MKKKHTLILLIMIVFAGVVLLGFNNVWAETVGTCSDELISQIKTAYSDYASMNVEACDTIKYSGNPGYVVIYHGFTSPDTHSYTVFPDPNMGKSKPPAISYYLFKIGCDLNSDPDHSGLNVTDTFKSCDVLSYEPYHWEKIQSSLNPNKKPESFIFYGGEELDGCNNLMQVVLGDECPIASTIPLPKCTAGPLLIADATCGAGTEYAVNVKIIPDSCGENSPQIECTFDGIKVPAAKANTPWMVMEDEDGTQHAFPPQKFGLDPGCILCTNKGPVAVTGNSVYLCPDPSIPSNY